MADQVKCPHCGAPVVYVNRTAEGEAICSGCGGRLYPSESAPRPIPGARARRRRDRDDDRPRRRRARDDDDYYYGRGRYFDPLRDRLSVPSIFLMVIAICQAMCHVSICGFIALMLVVEPQVRGNAGEALGIFAFVLISCTLFLCKDFFVLRGVAAMRNGRGHGRAMLGAGVACVPDVAWIFALIPAIWCLVVLNDPEVRYAFEENRYRNDEYDF